MLGFLMNMVYFRLQRLNVSVKRVHPIKNQDVEKNLFKTRRVEALVASQCSIRNNSRAFSPLVSSKTRHGTGDRC